MFKNLFKAWRNPKISLSCTLILFIILFIFVGRILSDTRQSFIENSAELSEHSVESYTEYYDKWQGKRLEGAQTYINIAHEPNFALTMIDPLILFCLFQIIVTGALCVFYEYRLARWRQRHDTEQTDSSHHNA
jgi:hypothetical protein